MALLYAEHFARLLVFVLLFNLVAASPVSEAISSSYVDKRQSNQSSNPLVVDLGYAIYQGTSNPGTGLSSWFGVRYARSTEQTRWQPPQAPLVNRSSIILANQAPPVCPSGMGSPGFRSYQFEGSEDCLFLNVIAPKNAQNLPVLVWIHGGGYGSGSADQNLAGLLAASPGGFVGVTIQYRLAAFGFLSSAAVQQYGVPNAGLYDQQYALKWTQKYISLFGGDPNRVTVAGQSAGAGSVMLQTMAMGGTLGTSLFRNAIASSPYLPTQPNYNDPGPTRNYNLLAQKVGCLPTTGASDAAIFQCLNNTDSYTLQKAGNEVSSSVLFGEWAFTPVTDGKFLRQIPSVQLSTGKVNGLNVLTSNQANEGTLFTPQNVSTEADFEQFVRTHFPRLTDAQVAAVLTNYPSTTAPMNPQNVKFATNGTIGATALNQSTFGTGQQQRANNLYAEATFVCPSYWLGDAFASPGRTAYRFQFSVIGALHGADLFAVFGPSQPNLLPSFTRSVMAVWNGMISKGNPRIYRSPNPALSQFPQWTRGATAKQLNFNETGGTPYTVYGPGFVPYYQFKQPGLALDISVKDAYSWEGGRGARCDFLKGLGASVPE